MIPSTLIKVALNRLRQILHKGDRYTCPICNYSSKNFYRIGSDIPVLKEKQVVGAGLRKGGCYKCDSNDRERLIFTFLKNEINFFERDKKIKILHIAPEKNLSLAFLAAGFENYICGDLFIGSQKYPHHVQYMNVLDLPFEDNSFDFIICNHVLEHIPDDLAAMREICRVLKNGGKSILQVPISNNTVEIIEDSSITSPEQREIFFGQYNHVRIYGQDYEKRLVMSGFTVRRINISEKYEKFGLNEYEDIFICEK